MPDRSVDAGLSNAAQDDFGEQGSQRVCRVDVNRVDHRPVHAQSFQSRFHQVHDEAGFCFQAFDRSVTQGDDPLACEYSFGQLTGPRDYKCRWLTSGARLAKGKAVQYWFAGGTDHGGNVRTSDRVDSVDKHAPFFKDLRVFGVECRKAGKCEWLW